MSMPDQLKRKLAEHRRQKAAGSWAERRRRDRALLATARKRDRARTDHLRRRYFQLKEAGDPMPASTVLQQLATLRNGHRS